MVSKVGLINNVQFKYLSLNIYGYTSKKYLSDINWPSAQKITYCWKLRKVYQNAWKHIRYSIFIIVCTISGSDSKYIAGMSFCIIERTVDTCML